MLKTSDQPQVMIGPAAPRPMPIHTPATINQAPKDDKAPKVVAPINFTEIVIVTSCFVAILIVLAFLFLSKDQAVTQEAAKVSISAAPTRTAQATAPAAPLAAKTDSSPESIEADLYFDVNKSKLRDESRELLQRYAELLKKENRWGLIVQGYTDQQGKSDYNKALGMKRADAAKKYLVELGVAESSVRVVSLGKEGTICDDQGEECRKLNRRVHLELRKNGFPVAAALSAPSVDEFMSSVTSSTEMKTEESGGHAGPTGGAVSTTPESPSASH